MSDQEEEMVELVNNILDYCYKEYDIKPSETAKQAGKNVAHLRD